MHEDKSALLWLAFNSIDVAEPVSKLEQMSTILDQLLRLVGEQSGKDYEAFAVVWEKQEAQE